jgi:hypothetical protein
LKVFETRGAGIGAFFLWEGAMDDADLVESIANRIKPLLAGHRPEIQSAVLADLLSMWLAGHYLMGSAAIETVLKHHIGLVRKLLPHNISSLKAREN